VHGIETKETIVGGREIRDGRSCALLTTSRKDAVILTDCTEKLVCAF